MARARIPHDDGVEAAFRQLAPVTLRKLPVTTIGRVDPAKTSPKASIALRSLAASAGNPQDIETKSRMDDGPSAPMSVTDKAERWPNRN